jgi:energy-coupling factor transporter ATP-binding protein EcfA2
MAYITKFSIDGLVGKKSIYAKGLNRDVNVIYGVNGSGKTSLLKILHSAMSNDARILSNVLFENAEVTIYSSKAAREVTLEIERSAVDKADEEQPSFSEGEIIFTSNAVSQSQKQVQSPELAWRCTPPLPEGFTRWNHVRTFAYDG